MAKKKKTTPLTEEQRQKALDLFNNNFLSTKELAEQFGIASSTMKAVLSTQRSPLLHRRKTLGRNEHQVKDYYNEVWKTSKLPSKTAFDVSNYGRIRSYAFSAEGKILKGKMHGGYLAHDYFSIEENKRKNILLHRLVALHFLPKPAAGKDKVIHIDGNKANNRADNLKWASNKETGVHGNTEANIAIRKERTKHSTKGVKLTLQKVELLRRVLADPKRTTRKKIIAKQFGISEMTLYRIQNGDLWGNKGSGAVTQKTEPKTLSNDVVKTIKKMLVKAKHSQAEIARTTGISETVISRIKQGQTYKHI